MEKFHKWKITKNTVLLNYYGCYNLIYRIIFLNNLIIHVILYFDLNVIELIFIWNSELKFAIAEQ